MREIIVKAFGQLNRFPIGKTPIEEIENLMRKAHDFEVLEYKGGTMKTITKTVEINVYTPKETLNELMYWHGNVFMYHKDDMFTDDKFNLEYLNEDLMNGLGLRLSLLQDYLDGYNNYYCDDFFMVFEQDDELYVLTYIA